MFLQVILVAMLAWYPISSFGEFELNESKIIQWAKKTNPTLDKINANQKGAEASSLSTASQYDPTLTGSYSYASSNEQAIIQFAPVFKPQKIASLTLSKQNSIGVDFNTQLFSQQISTADGFINNATQTGVRFGIEIDLWKNFFGSLDQSQLQSARINKDINDIQAEVSRESFVIDTRKIYWSLVANELSLELSKELVKTARAQLVESQRRIKDGLGDSGDVARNQAQLQSRESSVLFFSYQKEQIVANLKSVLPDFKYDQVIVRQSEALQVEQKAYQCIGLILQQNKMDATHSKYYEIMSLLQQRKTHEIELADSTDSIDLKLKGAYQASGVSDSHSEAFDRLTNQFRNGYEVGVALSIPLGGDISDARRASSSSTKNQFSAQADEIMLKLRSEHEKIKKSVDLLKRATRSQNDTVASLRKSLNQTRRKYKQARVSLNTYILEQDNLFNSELQLIETKLRVLHLLLDYFKVFTDHPCALNHRMGA